MNISPSDIHYEYDTRGYMLYYKDKPLGGAGIDKHAKGCRANLKLFKESAEIEKRNLLNGRGRKDMIAIIEKINEEETTNDN